MLEVEQSIVHQQYTISINFSSRYSSQHQMTYYWTQITESEVISVKAKWCCTARSSCMPVQTRTFRLLIISFYPSHFDVNSWVCDPSNTKRPYSDKFQILCTLSERCFFHSDFGTSSLITFSGHITTSLSSHRGTTLELDVNRKQLRTSYEITQEGPGRLDGWTAWRNSPTSCRQKTWTTVSSETIQNIRLERHYPSHTHPTT